MPVDVTGDVEQLLLSPSAGICIYSFLRYYGICSYAN